VNTHPLASSIADAVATRDLARLGTHLSENVAIRALLPGGVVQERGRDGVLGLFGGWFGEFGSVVLDDVGGEVVGDKILVHYKLVFDPEATRRVLTQTIVCTLAEGKVERMDLLCSGFRRF
jgi:hypothetical protein